MIVTNIEMSEYWNTRGGSQWVNEQRRYDTMLEPCGRRLLEAAALTSGESVLDVGCGNGAMTLEAAMRVGPQGHAVGIDLSGPMLDTARKRGRRGASAPASSKVTSRPLPSTPPLTPS